MRYMFISITRLVIGLPTLGSFGPMNFGDEIGDWQPEGYENDFAEDVFFSQA
jgi:hypothetical protein